MLHRQRERPLRAPVRRIAAHDADFSRYLLTTIRTGTSCQYIPDPPFPIVWTL
jgi:hypothetical protein